MDENKLKGVELNDEELEDVSGGSMRDFVDNITKAFKTKWDKEMDSKIVVGKDMASKYVLKKHEDKEKF